MRRKVPLWRALWGDESGQDIVEYVVLAAVLAVTAALALTQLDEAVNSGFEANTSDLTKPVSPPE